MSDSRLEKFIYAICSMDVSDLPVPLSRIEKLWNCLITGETPDFEPLSRNEKYLMAMLDRYDISNLPAPMSRGEKLLYKIAVGETDLSDVPGYLSRYEELLKYLIENGGISGGDFEYVLYTLNQSLYTLYTTAKKPVKSAILKGQTLVNDVDLNIKSLTSGNIITSDGYITINANSGYSNAFVGYKKIKPNTKYLCVVDINEYTANGEFSLTSANPQSVFNVVTALNSGEIGVKKFILTSRDTIDESVNIYSFRSYLNSNSTNGYVKYRVMMIEYRDGMENWDIPYFEGMQSVKMPVLMTIGKNLFNPAKMIINDGAIYGYYKYKDDESVRCTLSISDKDTSVDISGIYFGTSKSGKDSKAGVEWLISNGSVTQPNTLSFTTNNNFISIHPNKTEALNKLTKRFNIQLEHGEVKTTYEPHKSNILTVNEPIELRGIGEGSNRVEDELDCLTGEVVQNIGEIVLDGSDDESYDTMNTNNSNYLVFRTNTVNRKYSSNWIVDWMIGNGGYNYILNIEYEGLGFYASASTPDRAVIKILKSRLSSPDITGFREWLSQNPITVQYELATPIVKTVDLTVVDQDNQPTELGTFENVTNVSLEAENLIPEVEMEVATNLLEDTVFNLTDAFNTLYPTAAKPVKSAILKGQTLVNRITSHGFGGNNQIYESRLYDQPFNTGDIFTVFVVNPNVTTVIIGFNNSVDDSWMGERNYDVPSNKKITVTVPSDAICKYIGVVVPNRNDSTGFEKSLVAVEGDQTHLNVDTYFEGMQSVKMPVLMTTGKNLFNIPMSNESDFLPNTLSYRTSETIQLKPNTHYTLSAVTKDYIGRLKVLAVGDGSVWVDPSQTTRIFIRTDHNTAGVRTYTFTTTETGLFNLWYYDEDNQYNVSDFLESIQLEEGSVATSYEPHKSNILTVNEDVELRGIGDVQDTLDCLTGEVVERIGEVVLDGSEDWQRLKQGRYYLNNILNNVNSPDINIVNFKCDKLKTISYSEEYSGTLGIALYETTEYDFIVRTDIQTTEEFKQWLSNNPTTVQYQLKTKSVKTVDLTVQDQNGNETKLGTFDDTTHVLLNSEGLVPEATLTVRTKIPSASSTSLLMDDISTEQQQLETTVDEQSNNVDATMIATTEIFEETL